MCLSKLQFQQFVDQCKEGRAFPGIPNTPSPVIELARLHLHPTKINKIVVHRNCADGRGAALAAVAYCSKIKWDGMQFFSLGYSNDPFLELNLKSTDVIAFFDVCLSFDVMQRIKSLVKDIIVIDHHKTSRKNMRYCHFGFFDNNYSGARLAWDYFHYDEKTGLSEKVPPLFFILEDYDLWRFKIEYTRSIMMYFTNHKTKWNDFENWSGYFEPFLNPDTVVDSLYEVYQEGNRMLLDLDNHLQVINSQYYIDMIAGLRTAIIELEKDQRNWVSEIGSFLSNKGNVDCVLLWLGCNYGDSMQRFSLRSCDDRIDISRLAKYMGGGGHGCSAAFTYEGQKISSFDALRMIPGDAVKIPSKLVLPLYKNYKMELFFTMASFNESVDMQYGGNCCSVLFSYMMELMKALDENLENKFFIRDEKQFQWDFDGFSEQPNAAKRNVKEGIVYLTSIDCDLEQVFNITMEEMFREYLIVYQKEKIKNPEYYEIISSVPVIVSISLVGDPQNTDLASKQGVINPFK